jgi:GNAT superfamily N-acetyltransferase
VREAQLGDAGELAGLRWDFREGSRLSNSRSEFVSAFEHWFRSVYPLGQWVVVVAESTPGKLCGCIFLQCVEKVPSPGAISRSWGYVTNSYVASEFRSAGVGGQMLALIDTAARVRLLEFLIVWPSPASESFYLRAGFLPVTDQHSGADDSPPLELLLT